jgi:hypothetical protein
VLRGVGHDRGLLEPRLVEGPADRAHLPIDHRAGRDDVRAGPRLADRRLGEAGERRLVVDAAVRGERTAVAVIGVLAQASVGDRDERQLERPDPPERVLDDAVVRVRPATAGVLRLRQPEQDHATDAELGQAGRFVRREFRRQPGLPGHRCDRLADTRAWADEQRCDEHRGVQSRLAHERPERRGAPQPAGADGQWLRRGGGERHGHGISTG